MRIYRVRQIHSACTTPLDQGAPSGTLVFDLFANPGQKTPVNDPEIEAVMLRHLVRLMRPNEAPPEQFARLALLEVQRPVLLVGLIGPAQPKVLGESHHNTPSSHSGNPENRTQLSQF